MEDFRLSTTTYANPLISQQKEQQASKLASDDKLDKAKAVQSEAQSQVKTENKTDIKAENRTDAKAVSEKAKITASSAPIRLSISDDGVKALNDSKDGSVSVKAKSVDNIVSFSRNAKVENFSLDDAKESDNNQSAALNLASDDSKSRIKEMIEADKKASEKRAELLKEMNASDDEKAEDEKAEDTKAVESSESAKPPVTSFAGMTSAQIQTLYQQGRISYQTYMKQTEAKEEALKEQTEAINDTQADIVGLEAIKNQLLNGMPDQIKAEIA